MGEPERKLLGGPLEEPPMLSDQSGVLCVGRDALYGGPLRGASQLVSRH